MPDLAVVVVNREVIKKVQYDNYFFMYVQYAVVVFNMTCFYFFYLFFCNRWKHRAAKHSDTTNTLSK